VQVKKIWKKLSQEEIKERVFSALEKNVNFHDEGALGVPASYLDDKVFNQDATFLKDAPYISTLVQNPNHIGCHTHGKSEHFFQGTQAIEKELIEICAVDILGAEANSVDGYVASGGTEANMQAIWIYRNLFLKEHGAKLTEISILCSKDSHYSMDKAANLLSIDIFKYPIDFNTRKTEASDVITTIHRAKEKGIKYFIVICNMMTTMYGSVDDIEVSIAALQKEQCVYKLHIDGAYGGFYYPFANENNLLGFHHPSVTSVTLDAHKMAQAPYGTGIFLIRKGYIAYANTQEASYVEGEDYTLIGSRSGANAVAVWMILSKNGPYGWYEKVMILQKRTEWLCTQLEMLGLEFYRNPYSNIVTIKTNELVSQVALRFGLVPDSHLNPSWYKVVVMDHVSIDKLAMLVEELQKIKYS
jgi:tyrosine decarboxylase / aspartate 1-decarboxylase